jgi:hypothetical protein
MNQPGQSPLWKIVTVRAFVNKHIPRGYDECLVLNPNGIASYQPNGCDGLQSSVATLGKRSSRFFTGAPLLSSTFVARRLGWHFESPDDLPLEAIGKLISAISNEKWIEFYEQSRLMTRAGQKAKQAAPSASKADASRVDTKRRR